MDQTKLVKHGGTEKKEKKERGKEFTAKERIEHERVARVVRHSIAEAFDSHCSLSSLPHESCHLSSRVRESFFAFFVLQHLATNIVKFLTKTSDQRKRNIYNGAKAPIGWRSYRPGLCGAGSRFVWVEVRRRSF